MTGIAPEHRYRGHPAHPSPVEYHDRPVVIHVTVTVTHRRPILSQESAHEAVVRAWREATYWLVGNYVLMPDHLHLFCAPGQHGLTSLKRWVGYWKRLVGNADGSLKHAFLEDFWDTQMRSGEHYLRKLDYVRENPVRRGLVSSPEEWPYAGVVFPIRWA